jgi:dihydrofolate reductase
MRLLKREYAQLEKIQNKIILDTATSEEMTAFLNLIVKSGNESEMLNYMSVIGFDSIEAVQRQLNKKQKDENLKTGLVIAGGAILLALLFSK